MGCAYSTSTRDERTARSQKSFRVVNVDDCGHEINSGVISITDTDLILRQGESAVLWPLRSLRRYGFDAELFSFECGRRCPTGPGIYAFRCTEAEQLFNKLQEAINNCTSHPLVVSMPAAAAVVAAGGPAVVAAVSGQNVQPITGSTGGLGSLPATPVPDATTVISGRRSDATNHSSPNHSYVNAIHNYITSPIYNGPPSDSSISQPLNSNELPTTTVTDINTNYAKLDDLVRYYVNINTPGASSRSESNNRVTTGGSKSPSPISHVNETTAHHDNRTASLALENGSISSRRTTNSSTGMGSSRTPDTIAGTKFQFPPLAHYPTPSSLPSKLTVISDHSPAPSDSDPVNYILLDLDAQSANTTSSTTGASHYVSTAPATPVSKTPLKGETVWPIPQPVDSVSNNMPGTPTSDSSTGHTVNGGTRMSYAMIDFDKTDALTSAANLRKGLSIESSS